MKKRILAILIALVIFVVPFVSSYAATTMYVVASDQFINEGYLMDEDLTNGNVKGIEIERLYGYTAIFAIIDDALIDYYSGAEDLYYEMTDNSNGIILVHNIYDKEIDYFLAGDGQEVFGNYIQNIVDSYDATVTYVEGMEAYFYAVEDAITAYNSIPKYDGNTEDSTYTDGGYLDPENGGDTDESYDPEDSKGNLPAVIDDANILKESEIKELDEKLRSLSKESGFDFAFVTVEETGGISLNEYADMVYEYGGYKAGESDGTVLFVYQHGDEGEREIVIVRYGDKAEEAFSDSDCEMIINNVKSDFADGNYSAGFNKVVDEIEGILNPSVHWIWIPGCLIIGFVVAFIIMKIVASANKSVRKKVNATDYVRRDSLMVTGGSEIFIYSELKTSAKADNNTTSSNTNGGGRSTSSGKF